MAGDIKRSIQFLVHRYERIERACHVAEHALKRIEVRKHLILRTGLVSHSKEFHHAHRVGQALQGHAMGIVDGAHSSTGFTA